MGIDTVELGAGSYPEPTEETINYEFTAVALVQIKGTVCAKNIEQARQIIISKDTDYSFEKIIEIEEIERLEEE